MKIKKKEFDIFNLSFLDIISCGFGAVVLLVLISNTSQTTSQSSVVEVKRLLGQVMTLENITDALARKISQQRKKNDVQLADIATNCRCVHMLPMNLSQNEIQKNILAGVLKGISLHH